MQVSANEVVMTNQHMKFVEFRKRLLAFFYGNANARMKNAE